MKFLSKLISSLSGGFKRYPYVSVVIVVSALFGVMFSSYLDIDLGNNGYLMLRLFLWTHLLIPVFFALSLSRKFFKNRFVYFGVLFGVSAALFLYVFLIFPGSIEASEAYRAGGLLAYRYLTVLSLSVLSIFILPYIVRNRDSGDKDFLNKSQWGLLSQIVNGLIIAVIYGVVVQIGLSLALGALDVLWEIDVKEWQYLAIAIFSYNFVGYLRLINSVDNVEKTVKVKLNKISYILAKFILLPLTGIYTLILIPYIFKIIITGDWPENMITGLTLLFLLLSYSTVFLLFFSKKLKLLKFHVSRLLPAISIPIILMQMYGLGIRINAYGITVNRFVLVSFAILSLLLSFYFVLGKKPRLMAIPVIFIVLAVFAIPTAFYVSEKKQLKLHVELLDESGAVDENGIIIGFDKEKELSPESTRSVIDGFDYLLNYHKITSLKSVLDTEIYDKIDDDTLSSWSIDDEYLTQLNITSSYRYNDNDRTYSYRISTEEVDLQAVDGGFTMISNARCVDCERDSLENGLEVEIDSKIYLLSTEQIELIMEHSYSMRNEPLILDEIEGNSVLLVFSFYIREDSEGGIEVSNMHGWVLE